MAVLMRGLRRWAGYPALNRPLTILGVERRGFLLSATLGLAMWNATASLVTGGVVFAVGFGAGWLAGRKGPRHAWRAPRGHALPVTLRPGQVGRRAMAPRDPERAMRIAVLVARIDVHETQHVSASSATGSLSGKWRRAFPAAPR